jgi:hypothetical protein
MKASGPDKARPAAVGLRAHSGWASLVVVTTSRHPTKASRGRRLSCLPTVISRQRLPLAKSGNTTQPYHAAQVAALEAAGAGGLSHRGEKQSAGQQAGRELNLARAKELIEQAEKEAFRFAKQGFKALLAQLRRQGYVLLGCGILSGSGRVPDQLVSTLASHIAIHSAEGELFRNALARAAEDCGLRVMRISERNLLAQASATLTDSAEDLQRQITEIGKALGPPWCQDEKFATLIAWLALTELPRQAWHS